MPFIYVMAVLVMSIYASTGDQKAERGQNYINPGGNEGVNPLLGK